MSTIIVTTGTDTVANDGKTSLREAVSSARAGDTIVFAADVGHVDLNQVLTIAAGTNLTIEGSPSHQVGLLANAVSLPHLLVVNVGATLTLRDVKIGGNATGANGSGGINGPDGTNGTDGLKGADGVDEVNGPGQPGSKGGDATNATTGTAATTAGGSGLGSIANFGTLTLDHVVLSAEGIGAPGGDGGTGGSGGNGGAGGSGGSGNGGGNGANGGKASEGAQGGNGSSGGSAAGGIYNGAGAHLTLIDSVIHDSNAFGGDGGKGGDGGAGGNGGAGGSGGNGPGPGSGANGGSGDDGGLGGNGGAGGSAIGGIWNDGTLTIAGGAILYANSSSAGAGGAGGAGGTGSAGGIAGQGGLGPGPTHGADGLAGSNGVDGAAGTSGNPGLQNDNYGGVGTLVGSLTLGGHFYEFGRSDSDRSTPAVLVGGQGAGQATNVFYTINEVGDGSTTGSVGWRIIGSNVPASDFVGGVMPSGALNFGSFQSFASINFALNPDKAAPRNEGFTIELYNPATGDVLGTLHTAAQAIVNVRVDNHNNNVVATPYADLIMGLGGNDTLRGLGGDDTLVGGAGADVGHGALRRRRHPGQRRSPPYDRARDRDARGAGSARG